MVTGAGCAHQDRYGDWLRQREVAENGMILVRPDKHIAWRAHHLVADPHSALTAVLSTILSRDTADDNQLSDVDLAELTSTAGFKPARVLG